MKIRQIDCCCIKDNNLIIFATVIHISEQLFINNDWFLVNNAKSTSTRKKLVALSLNVYSSCKASLLVCVLWCAVPKNSQRWRCVLVDVCVWEFKQDSNWNGWLQRILVWIFLVLFDMFSSIFWGFSVHFVFYLTIKSTLMIVIFIVKIGF